MENAFDRAACFTMAHEGGAAVSDHAADPGGLTKYGISQRAYPQLNIRALTEDDALAIYRRDYWDKARCGDMPAPVGIAFFDFAFNSGTGRAARALQKILALPEDGIIGPRTLAAVKASHQPDTLALWLNAERLGYLSTLSTWPTFGRGWLRRVLALQNEVGKL